MIIELDVCMCESVCMNTGVKVIRNFLRHGRIFIELSSVNKKNIFTKLLFFEVTKLTSTINITMY